MKNINKNENQGFTLIEIMVASVIFLIVVTIYTGVYVATIRVNSKMIALQKNSK